MKLVRYPVKLRVQEPHHKAYVLLLSAIEYASIHDFALKVEQSAIVENAVRILKMVLEYSIERKKGCLFENAFRLRRALEMRSWCNEHCALCECPGIDDGLRVNLRNSGPRTLIDLRTMDVQQTQTTFKCAILEAQNLVRFARSICRSSLDLSQSRDSSMLKLSLRPAFTAKQNEMDLGLVYKLAVIHSDSGDLIYASDVKYNDSVQEIYVAVDRSSDVRVLLLAPYAILDQQLYTQDKDESTARKQIFQTPIKGGNATNGKGKKTTKKTNSSKIGYSNLDSESKLSEENGVYKYDGGAGIKPTLTNPVKQSSRYDMDSTHEVADEPHFDQVRNLQKSPPDQELNRIRKMAMGLGNNISVKRLRTTFTSYPAVRSANIKAEHPNLPPFSTSTDAVPTEELYRTGNHDLTAFSFEADVAPIKASFNSENVDFSAFSYGADVAPIKELFRTENHNFPAYSLGADVVQLSQPSVRRQQGFESSRVSLGAVASINATGSASDTQGRSFFKKPGAQSFFKATALSGGTLKEPPGLAPKITDPRIQNSRPSPCIFSKEFTDAFF